MVHLYSATIPLVIVYIRIFVFRHNYSPLIVHNRKAPIAESFYKVRFIFQKIKHIVERWQYRSAVKGKNTSFTINTYKNKTIFYMHFVIYYRNYHLATFADKPHTTIVAHLSKSVLGFAYKLIIHLPAFFVGFIKIFQLFGAIYTFVVFVDSDSRTIHIHHCLAILFKRRSHRVLKRNNHLTQRVDIAPFVVFFHRSQSVVKVVSLVVFQADNLASIFINKAIFAIFHHPRKTVLKAMRFVVFKERMQFAIPAYKAPFVIYAHRSSIAVKRISIMKAVRNHQFAFGIYKAITFAVDARNSQSVAKIINRIVF